jgi:NitT/TauT family transport system substrate-binding protein
MIARRQALKAIVAAGGMAAAPTALRAQTLETVNCGKLIGVTDAAFYIGDKKGFFKEAGINVNWTTFPQSQAMVAPLAAGQLDAMGASVSAGIYNAIGNGIPIHIVGDRGVDVPGYGALPLVVRAELVKSGRFKSLGDLKGLRCSEPGKGSSNLPILYRFLRKGGLGYDDVQHLFLPFADQVAGLRNGSMDAGVLIEPFATLVVREGSAVKIAPDTDVYTNHQVSALMYSTPFMKNKPDAAKRFFLGYLRALRYYKDALHNGKFAGPNAPSVIAILQEFIKLPDPTLWREITPSSVNADGHVVVPSLETDYQIYKERGLITDPITVPAAVDLGYADAANRQLGRYVPASA